MSAAYRGPYIADHGPRSIRIYTTEHCPRLVVTIRTVDHGSLDDLLRAYGWHRIERWQHSVDDGHRVATVERINEPAIDVRGEADGWARYGASDG